MWLWLPLCHLSVFFIFLLFRTLWLLRPPRDDSGGWWHRLLPTHFLTLPPATPARRSVHEHAPRTSEAPSEALLSRGAGRGVTDEEGAKGTDPSQNRPLLRVSAPSLPQSPSQQDPPGLRGRATRLRQARGGTPRRPPSATSGKAPSPASPGPGVWPGTPPSQCPWHPSVVTHRPRPERLREPGVGSARGGKVTGRATFGVASGRTN